jgi:hypothetical protein
MSGLVAVGAGVVVVVAEGVVALAVWPGMGVAS